MLLFQLTLCFGISSHAILTAEQDDNQEDLSLLVEHKNYNNIDVTCVASSTSVLKKGLSMWKKNDAYLEMKTPVGVEPIIDCKFVNDRYEQVFLPSYYELSKDMLLDSRFERLPTVETKCNGKFLQYQPEIPHQLAEPIHVSVLAKNDAHLSICLETDNICLWFIIGGWSGYYTALRICSRREIHDFYPATEEFPSKKNNCYNKIRNAATGDVSNDKWNHFTITMKNELITLSKLGREIPILQYRHENGFKNNQYISIGFRTYKPISMNICGLWKIHQKTSCQTTQIESKRSEYLTLPNKNNIIMFVKMCSYCSAVISLSEYYASTYTWHNTTSTKLNTERNSITTKWQEIVLYSRTNAAIREAYITIEPSIISNSYNNENKPQEAIYWAIDNIHFTNKSISDNKAVIKESFLKVDEDIVVCEDVAITRTVTYDTSARIHSQNEEMPCINIEDSFGKNCETTCESVLSKNCSNTIICSAQDRCSCASGYMGVHCEQDILPILLNTPKITIISATEVQVEIVNKSYTKNAQKPYYYLVQYRKSSTLISVAWNCDNIWKPFTEEKLIFTISDLNPSSTYKFRIVLGNKAYKYNTSENIPVTTPIRLCIDISELDLTIHPFEYKAYFEWKAGLCAFEISLLDSLNQTTNIPKSISDNYKENIYFPISSDLEPDTNYIVLITNLNRYSFQKSFKTALSSIIVTKKEVTSNSVTLEWNIWTRVSQITEYKIEYWEGGRLRCPEKYDNEHSKVVKSPFITIDGLMSYSKYQFKITAMTISETKKTDKFMLETKEEEYPQHDETPRDLRTTNIAPRKITLEWELPDCNKMSGPLDYKISYICTEEWCTLEPKYQTCSSSIKRATLEELEPFSTYTLSVITHRPSTNKSSIENQTLQFKTSSTNPPQVTKLDVYSKNATSISLRWRKPYPPHGILSSYKIKYWKFSQVAWNNWERTELFPPIPCKIWPQFDCYTLHSLGKDVEYNLKIAALNKGNEEDYESINELHKTRIKTAEEASQKPDDFAYIPFENVSQANDIELNLQWNHPNITNGLIRNFTIVIELIHENKNITEAKIIDNEEYASGYNYMVKNLKPSSQYNFYIYPMNEFRGENSKIENVMTPPRVPMFSTLPKIEVMSDKLIINTKHLDVVESPTIHESYMYVISEDYTTKTNEELLTSFLKADLLVEEWSDVPQIKFYTKFTFTELLRSPVEIQNKHKPECFQEETECTFTMVIASRYKHFVRYSTNVLTSKRYLNKSKTRNLKAIWLPIFLVIFVGIMGMACFVLIKKKKINLRSALGNVPLLRSIGGTATVSIEEVPNRNPDVIPMTTTTRTNNPLRQRRASSVKPKKQLEIVEPNEEVTFNSKLIPLMDFETYVKNAVSNGELELQHKSLKRGMNKPHDYGLKKENKSKNRYNNLIPYDDTRVKLEKIRNDDYSDYINANYIDGYDAPKGYIATQGPKPNTLDDFWRMIWQENCSYIVMLANVYESGKKKTEQYWPEHMGVSEAFGNISVINTTEDVFADYVYRTFIVTCNEEERQVEQLHFTAWPDHGVPIYHQTLVPFLRKMLTIPQRVGPTVIHCSAGIGRTGTIILCDLSLRMAAREGALDLMACYRQLREQRANMVDNIDQYKLAHVVLVECLFGRNTSISCDSDFNTRITNILEQDGVIKDMQYLLDIQWLDVAIKSPTKYHMDSANNSKNRYPNIVPEYGKVFLARYPYDDVNSDYINAITVDGFRVVERFVATQQPLLNTVGDFWRMIVEKKSNVIVLLNNLDANDKSAAKFWPKENEIMTPVPYIELRSIKNKNQEPFKNITIEMLNKKDKDNPKTTVNLILLKGWPVSSSVPQSLDNVLLTLDKMDKLANADSPIVICCHDGQTACGFFVALSFLLDKIRLEQICDVCLAVRVARKNKSQFVNTKDQFDLLYQGAVKFLSQFETYSNFTS